MPTVRVNPALQGLSKPDYSRLKGGGKQFWPKDDPVGSGEGGTKLKSSIEGVFLGVKTETYRDKARNYFVVQVGEGEAALPHFITANQFIVAAFETSGAEVGDAIRCTYLGGVECNAPTPAREIKVEKVTEPAAKKKS